MTDITPDGTTVSLASDVTPAAPTTLSEIGQPTREDMRYALIKGSLGALPWAGGLAAEFFALKYAAPVEKRREQWLSDLHTRLLALEQQGRAAIDEIEQRPETLDAFMVTTRAALETSDSAKIERLRNALLNTIVDARPETLHAEARREQLLRLVETVTTWQARILDVADRHADAEPRGRNDAFEALVENAHPALAADNAFVPEVLQQLGALGLIRNATASKDGAIEPLYERGTGRRIYPPSELGLAFLLFVRDPSSN